MANTATREGAAPTRAAADWESIEREYRAGVYSVREIGRRHNVSEAAIRKRAKEKCWRRDLTTRVHAELRTRLTIPEAKQRIEAEADPEAESRIVDEAASTLVQVVTVHRQDIAKGRSLIELLFGQLNEAAAHRDDIEEAIEDDTREDKTAERRNRMRRAVSLPMHAATMRDLSQALRHVVGLERQAFNLDDRPPDDPEPSESLSQKVVGKILSDLQALAQ